MNYNDLPEIIEADRLTVAYAEYPAIYRCGSYMLYTKTRINDDFYELPIAFASEPSEERMAVVMATMAKAVDRMHDRT